MDKEQNISVNIQAIESLIQQCVMPILIGVGEITVKIQQWAASVDWAMVGDVLRYLVDQLPKEVAKLSVSLANRGWFIWFSEEGISEIAELLKMSETEQDIHLINFLESKITTIKQELLTCYPDRATAINDAFNAHDAKFYSASITALLALSEGICKDHFPDIGLYSKHPADPNKTTKPGMPKTDDLFDGIPPLDIFEAAFLKPLRISTALTKNIYKPNAEEHLLFNRHLIMHGASKGYGHQENSLKALGLAFFVHKSLTYLKEKASAKT